MAAPRSGNNDRGWNDPPIFNYGMASQSQASPRRSMLNKRVAYPMATPPTTAGESSNMTANILNPAEGPPKLGSVQLLPPATNTSTPTPVPVLVPTLIPTPEPGAPLSPVSHPGVARPVLQATESKETLEDLLKRLQINSEVELLQFVQETLTSLRDKCNEELKGRAYEDVTKRIALIQEMWQGGKISGPVRLQLGQLVSALKEDNIDLANSIHLSLMVDYTNEVNQWMVGVKRLIQGLCNQRGQGSTDTSAEGQGQKEVDEGQGQSSENQEKNENTEETENS